MYHIHRKKIITLLCIVLFSSNVFGQGMNNFRYDYARWIHFGFTVGTNFSTLKYDLSKTWYEQKAIHAVKVEQLPGITIGAVADLHLGEYFDLRFIPSLILTQRNLIYSVTGDTVQPKQIESAIVEGPLLLKFKSERHRNIRFYVIGGGKYGYDLSSNYKAVKDPLNPKVALLPHNFSYEFGAGLDMYFPFFKFSPEIKLSRGINNVLARDDKIYTQIFDRFRSNFIMISLYFEG